MKKIKRIKENITQIEYKKLLDAVRGNDNLRDNTKLNLLRTYTILYYTGIRLNEIQTLRIIDIKNLIKNGELKILTSKTKSERKIFVSINFKKDLLKVFDFKIENENNLIIVKGSNKNKQTSIKFS